MLAIAKIALRVSDKHNDRTLQVAPLGSRCDWQQGETIGRVTNTLAHSVLVATKYGEAYVDRDSVSLIQDANMA